MRKKYRSEMNVQEYMDVIGPSKACLKRAIDSMFEPNPDFHKFLKMLKEREVRKKMAIDYKEEWEKLMKEHGENGIVEYGVAIKLGTLMRNQIHNTIQNREELMEEYVKSKIETEIIRADGGCHKVKLEVLGEPRGTIMISKNAFNTWLKNRKEVK